MSNWQTTLDEATHCTRCEVSLLDLPRTGTFKEEVCEEVLCPKCVGIENLNTWRKNKELCMKLVMDAQSAVFHSENNYDRIRPIYASLYRENVGSYHKVMDSFNEICDYARMLEIGKWFGCIEKANMETVKLSRDKAEEYEFTDDHKFIYPDIGVKTTQDSIKTYYKNTEHRGHSFRHTDFEVFLWGSAGRVLMTIKDSRAYNNENAKFGGANITLIFDETSDYPRGGIQSLCGTKEECMGLLRAAMFTDIKFVRDDDVSCF